MREPETGTRNVGTGAGRRGPGVRGARGADGQPRGPLPWTVGGPAPPGLCFPGPVSPPPSSFPGHVPAAGDRRMGSWSRRAAEATRAPPPRPHPARPGREALGYFWPVPSAFGGPAQAAPSWTHPGGRPGTPSSAQATLCSAPACRFFEDLGSDLGGLDVREGARPEPVRAKCPPGWAWGSDGAGQSCLQPDPCWSSAGVGSAACPGLPCDPGEGYCGGVALCLWAPYFLKPQPWRLRMVGPCGSCPGADWPTVEPQALFLLAGTEAASCL